MVTPEMNMRGPIDSSQCASSTTPRVAAAGMALLARSAHRTCLYMAPSVESVDVEATAFVHVTYANTVPYIAFSKLSDVVTLISRAASTPPSAEIWPGRMRP